MFIYIQMYTSYVKCICILICTPYICQKTERNAHCHRRDKHVYVYTYINTYSYIYTQTYIHVCVYLNMYIICTYSYMYTHTQIHIYTCTYTHLDACITACCNVLQRVATCCNTLQHTATHTFGCIHHSVLQRVYIYMYIHIHTSTYTCTNLFKCIHRMHVNMYFSMCT